MVLKHFHENWGHWRKDKMFKMMREKHHCVGMYKDIIEHEVQCIECKTRLMKKFPCMKWKKFCFHFKRLGLILVGHTPSRRTATVISLPWLTNTVDGLRLLQYLTQLLKYCAMS